MADPSQNAFGYDGRGQSFAQSGGFSRPFQHPADNPQSSYNALRSERFGGGPSQFSAPVPPSHGNSRGPTAQDLAHTQSVRTNSTVTPGVDNLGAAAAGGGIAGIATGVAQANERQSGIDAMQDVGHGDMARSLGGHDPYASNVPLGAAMDGPGQTTPGAASHFTPSERSIPTGYGQPNPYQGVGGLYDGPYRGSHASWGPGNPAAINPDDIIDDGDDGFLPNPQRRSVLSLGRNSSHNSLPVGGASAGAGAGAGAAAAGGVLGTISNRVNGQTTGSPSGGPAYDAVPGEKSEWLARQNTGRKRMKWIVGLLVAFVIIGAIVGGTVGGILGSRNNKGSGSSGSTDSATDDTDQNGDLGKDSDEIKVLMNNPDLHKVFPGVDYTPWGVQYPDCLKWPPSQNNVTRDMAVLSQLTNTIRLYGNDCNQTEMVMHAMDRLELKDMKLWLGVWIDINNKTTNDRQMKRLHQIIDNTKDKSIFKGVVVGNEVLFSGSNQASTALTDLSNYMKDVKDELKKNGIDLPVATSDLGINWTDELAKLADVVMANVHPFFGGVPIDQAASWTWSFWQDHDVSLTKGTDKKQVISEVGWPSGGGNDCAPAETCPDKTSGAVAGIDELNQFMADWVCQSLDNGTDYFWFEAFDEPWKIRYNEPDKGKNWEDKWGLMDPGRNLKPGVKIPDCGGKTVS